MAAKKRKTTIHGVEVEQVDFSGNWYTPVDERIRLALWADPHAVQGETAGKYRVLEHSIIPVGDRWAYTCTVEYPAGSGNTYPGSDFIDLKDPAGLAKAETSAVGRGLGMAGIASKGGVASYEEIARLHQQTRQQAQQDDDGGTWDYLSDLKFRQYVEPLGYRTQAQIEELVAEACGGAEPSKALVRAHIERLMHLNGAQGRRAGGHKGDEEM